MGGGRGQGAERGYTRVLLCPVPRAYGRRHPCSMHLLSSVPFFCRQRDAGRGTLPLQETRKGLLHLQCCARGARDDEVISGASSWALTSHNRLVRPPHFFTTQRTPSFFEPQPEPGASLSLGRSSGSFQSCRSDFGACQKGLPESTYHKREGGKGGWGVWVGGRERERMCVC